MRAGHRWWRYLALAGVVGSVALLLVVALRSLLPAPLAPGTPEATVHAYAAALLAGDRALARSHFSEEYAARCRPVAFEAMVERSLERLTLGRVDRTLVFLASSELSDARVSVRVCVSHNEVQPPLGVNTWSSDHTFVLVREGEA